MMKSYDYNDIRKHGNCADRGHDFKRFDGGRYFPAHYRCKCGATAVADWESLTLNVPKMPKTLEQKAAESAKRRARHGT